MLNGLIDIAKFKVAWTKFDRQGDQRWNFTGSPEKNTAVGTTPIRWALTSRGRLSASEAHGHIGENRDCCREAGARWAITEYRGKPEMILRSPDMLQSVR